MTRTRIEEVASPELIEQIKQLWATELTKEAIAEKLGLSSTYLLNQVRDKYGLDHRSGSRNGEVFLTWTENDDVFLRANYKKLGAQEVAKKISRTVSSVHARASDLMLSNKKLEWTSREDELLLNLRDSQCLPFSSIAAHLPQRTNGACAARYKYLIKKQ